jgi:hypothetical protein
MNIHFGYGRRTVAATLALVGLIVLTGLATAAQPSEEPPATNLTTVAPPALGKPPAARHHRGKPRVARAPAVGIRPVASVCAWDGFDWDQLSNAERQAWETLGWSRARWETGKDASSSSRDWSELSDTERNAAGRLGFAADNWNVVCSSGVAAAPAEEIRPVVSVCVWADFDWDQLSNAERQAWEALGWSRTLWETDNSTGTSSSRNWSDLSDTERNAAERLGFDAENWNVVCPPVLPGPDDV